MTSLLFRLVVDMIYHMGGTGIFVLHCVEFCSKFLRVVTAVVYSCI